MQTKFKVGDEVIDSGYGVGVVYDIKISRDYPVQVIFGQGREITYTLNGNQWDERDVPSLKKLTKLEKALK